MKNLKNYWLFNKPVAHRGLWGGNIVENSLTAYKAAADNGYPIEIDLFLTTDGEIVCFHDDTLTRMTGASGKITDKSLAELKALSLNGTAEKIPTLKEVLDVKRSFRRLPWQNSPAYRDKRPAERLYRR